MQLLCLCNSDPGTVLPGLALLAHDTSSTTLGGKVMPGTARRFDLIVVDGTRDIGRARVACLELKRDCPTPRLLVATDSALPAVTAEWDLAGVLLPTAGPAEIEMRLRLALSTRTVTEEDQPEPLEAAGIVINEASFTAQSHGRMLDLTYKEFELLHFLTANPGRVFTREQLLGEVWGTDYFGGTRTVDVHIRRLRAKLGEHEALISTVWGVGYGFARETPDDNDDAGGEEEES